MSKHLILVKHSMPEIDPDQPAHTWRLSEEGRFRAQRLADELENFAPDVLVSSTEPKARETAEIVAARLQLELQEVEDLHEHDRSNVPFLPYDTFQVSLREFFQQPHALVFGMETADQADARFYRAVHAILNEHRDKSVVIVSHGTVISLFVARLTGSSALDLWTRLGLPSFVAMDLHSSTLIVKSTIV
jgi:broad specificity phosphatase PhoE